MEDVLIKLEKEAFELYVKLRSLRRDLSTRGFRNQAGKRQYDLMFHQYEAMQNYLDILDTRIEDLKGNQE